MAFDYAAALADQHLAGLLIWRFLDLHAQTLTKTAHAARRVISTQAAWFSSTKRAPRPRWPGSMDGRSILQFVGPVKQV